MLSKKYMQEIQDLKLRGYSINEITRYYEEQGRKMPSLPTPSVRIVVRGLLLKYS
ncbi:hypothetical protein [Anoxynatronum buryatiense]|nr:hypothetical protein [Anoxynatronum buryatiense]